MSALQREESWQLMKTKVKNVNLQKHMLATEAILGKIVPIFQGDVEDWGLAGLLHDIDYEETAKSPKLHGIKSAEFLQNYDIPAYVIDAIKVHPRHGERKTDLAKALYAVDPLTGLIVAVALIHPDKKLDSLDTQFIINHFEERSFARGANREQIRSCTLLGFELEEFINIGLLAMQSIAADLGL